MKYVLAAFALGCSVVLSVNAQVQSRPSSNSAQQPNIIFILADDLGYGDVGVFFQNQRRQVNDRSEPYTYTPQLDKLANSGALLPQHYTAAPVCAPARASFLLGVHQGHANVRNNQFDKALEDNHTVASVLRAAGYKTAVIGKWGLQGNGKGPDWPAHPLNRGFDYYLGMIRHGDGHEHYPKEGLYRGSKQVFENRANIAEGLDKCYTADLWTAAAKKWITDFEKTNKPHQPFFMYLAYETPHAVQELPTQAYPAGGGLKGGMQWVGTPGHMINTASGTIDSWYHPDYAHATYDHDKNPSTPEVPWPDVYKRYATSVRRIDDAIADLMQLLRDLNIDDNTLVVFSSDNGPSIESYLKEDLAADFFNSFGPFEGIKRDVWEGGVRVPTIAHWPGHIAAGTVITTPSAQYDWLPTFAEAAGVPAPARIDGVSLLPSLTGKGKQVPGTVYVEYFHNGTTPAFEEFDKKHRKRRRGDMQMIRMGDTVGVRYNIQSKDDDFEIYNVADDPKQVANLSSRPGMAAVQQRMKAAVLQLRRPDSSSQRPYDEALVPAAVPERTTAGVRWKAVSGDFPWVANVDDRKAAEAGVTTVLNPGIAQSVKKGVILFEGFIDIPADGTYTFSLTANSGALLRIHDATVIDADFGYRPGAERSGTMRLQKGLHPVRLYYSLKQGPKAVLDLKWEGPGVTRQGIPAANLKY